MRKKTRYCVIAALAAAAFLGLGIPAQAVLVPTHGQVVHLDLNNPGSETILPRFMGVPAFQTPVVGGPTFFYNGGLAVRFYDGLFHANQMWHWETEIDNPNPFRTQFRIGFAFPNGGGPITGWLVLAPGWRAIFDISVKDNPPETGYHVWSAFANLPYPVSADTSITENIMATVDDYGKLPGYYYVRFLGPNGETVVPQSSIPIALFIPDRPRPQPPIDPPFSIPAATPVDVLFRVFPGLFPGG